MRVNWEQNEGQHRPVLRYGWDVCEMVIQVQQIRQGHMLPVSTLTPCREPDQRPCVPSAGVLSPMSPLGLPWIWRPLDQPAYSPAREAGRAVGWWERGPAYPGYGCGPIGIPSLRNTGHQRHRVSLGKQTPRQFLPSKINTSHLRELGKPRNMKDNRNIKRKKGNTQFYSLEMSLGTFWWISFFSYDVFYHLLDFPGCEWSVSVGLCPPVQCLCQDWLASLRTRALGQAGREVDN